MTAEPALATRLAETLTVICVGLTVAEFSQVNPEAPVHEVFEAGKKLIPLMVRVNEALPAGTEAGLMLVIMGNARTGTLTGADVPPSVVTVTFTLPAAAIRLAGTVALSELPT